MGSNEGKQGKSIRIRRKNEVGWLILLCVLLFNEQDTRGDNAVFSLGMSVGFVLVLFTILSGIGAAYYALMKREYSNVFGLSGVSIIFALAILGAPRVHTLNFAQVHGETTATEDARHEQTKQRPTGSDAERVEFERVYMEFMQRPENGFLLAPDVKTAFDARVVELIQGGMTFRDALYLSMIEARERG